MKIDSLLSAAVAAGASDIHLCAELPPMIRVNGKLSPMGNENLTRGDCRAFAEELLPPDKMRAFEENGEIDISYGVAGLGRFRVNIYMQRSSIAIALRVIPHNIRTLDELGLPPVLGTLARRPNGLVLVTGPTGSGKSTTLAAMIDLINSERSCHIVTLEDPIEYLHRHKKSIVNQREIGADTKSFHKALRAALRQDPDVILVGEMRDLETTSIALTAAETGHLVLATLHTNDAAKTIDRIVDQFPPNQQAQVKLQLSGALQGIVAQQLLPRADQPGRVAALEILVATPAIKNLIRESKTHQIPSAIQTGAKFGMKTMEASLRELLEKGIISPEDFNTLTGDATGPKLSFV